MYILICENCGKEFERHFKHKNQRVFCSHECSSSFKRDSKKIAVLCSHCGKEVLKYPSHVKKAKTHFCSVNCHKKTMYSNEYIIDNEITKLIVRSPKYGIKEVLIDTKHVNLVKKYSWLVSKRKNAFYVVSSCKKVLLHRLVTDCPDKLVPDHINHDTLNNLEKNLRVGTYSENLHNKKISKYNKSGHTGVFWLERLKKWYSYFEINKKRINLGYYENINDAIDARIKAELKYLVR